MSSSSSWSSSSCTSPGNMQTGTKKIRDAGTTQTKSNAVAFIPVCVPGSEECNTNSASTDATSTSIVCINTTASTTTHPNTLKTASITASNSTKNISRAKGLDQTRRNGSNRDFRGGQETWSTMLYELLAYKVHHNGDTNVKVSKEHTKEQTLYLWLQNQRRHYRMYIDGRASFLNEERIKILELVGVNWNVKGDVFWDKMYHQLIEYKQKHGNAQVPRKWDANPKLGEWVTDQRRQYQYKLKRKHTLLTDERQRKLDEVNFTWSLRSRIAWDDRYKELVQFQRMHGHCVVPQLYEANKPLGKWVSKQREHYRYYLQGKYSFMTEARINLLNNLGFQWSAKGRNKDQEIKDMHQSLLEQHEAIQNSTGSSVSAVASTPGNSNEIGSATFGTAESSSNITKIDADQDLLADSIM
mmetsp:Transcript_22364/g.25911  ORF Transcript_22364/g.25911 Transcript_22364/m.25911 type:complete len:413 (+) Transcript_22364:209-1447(+)